MEQSVSNTASSSTYPDPKEHCEICRWRTDCDTRRRTDDHLCLVAGITKIQITELQRRQIATATELARLPLPLPWKPERGATQSYERCREQARVQIDARAAQRPLYEILTPVPDTGLHRLPAPSRGDIFFDLEADPFFRETGLEYLFGYITLDADGEQAYVEEWALTPAEEKAVFERFVDFAMARWAQYPDLHIYHYAPYEPGALKRLMGRYATREDEIDRMLRGHLFIDLYTLAKQSIRASVESYTIKNLEVLYDFARPVALVDARRALATIQACLELDDIAGITDEVRRVIAGYNRDDCVSALKLRDWLERIRATTINQGASIPRPAPESAEPSEEVDERQRKVAELIVRLTADVPANVAERSADQHARWILAHTLDWHRREQKSVWWEFYRLSDLTAEELFDERAGLSALNFVAKVGGTARAPIHRYRFPPQETEFRGGEKLCMPGGDRFGAVESISFENCTVDIKTTTTTASVHPAAVFAHDFVRTDEQANALARLAEHVSQHGLSGLGPHQPARDLLLRRVPRVGDEPLREEGETTVAAAERLAAKLAGGVLAIQGPPGAGKTFTAARMICALVQAGKRVGVTANSHKVIGNLLTKVVAAADQAQIELQCIQKLSDNQDPIHRIRFTKVNEEVFSALNSSSCQVAAGTPWLWAREDAFETVDVLFVDEAAQMSLANVLAVSQACKTIVLLGDPQQLEQPVKGSHPEGTDVSALDHLLQGKATIGSDRGLFLEETWRLHPDLCAFTSELFYEGRLTSRPELAVQTVKSTSRVNGTGLRFLPVQHDGNQSFSPEEADKIRDVVNEILSANSSWIDPEGREQPLTLNDTLIVAPYNAQVFELQERLPGARIGTVDKFQGQEAPIVIYSMTTSTHTDAPRGMNFLYNLNRLNVATSRARCICILVCSPQLFEPECRTPEQIKMANAFCRYVEIAKTI